MPREIELLQLLQSAWELIPNLKPKHPDYFKREIIRAGLVKAKSAPLSAPATALVTIDGGNVQSVEITGRATVTVRDFDQDGTPESELTGCDGRHGYVDAIYTGDSDV